MTKDWQQQVTDSITSIDELCRVLNINPSDIASIEAREFPLRVSRGFVARMKKGDPNDPLLLQVLPQVLETLASVGFTKDPVKDLSAASIPGLLHKYHGRVLLTLTGACAIHCRYCFRQYFPYNENMPNMKAVVEYIQSNETITEVILSGGDPLVLKDKQLGKIINVLSAIKHVKTLRFHTRLPIVIPDRITDDFLRILEESRLNSIIVIHTNHANEIDDSVRIAINKMRSRGIVVLNQSVLLKNINDTAEVLIQLSERLFEIGVLPYYLHLLDRVAGCAHFDVSEDDAIQLHQAITEKLPGYLVPKLVREVAGELSKVSVS